MMSENQPVLQVTDLMAKVGKRILFTNLEFAVKAGKSLAIVGPSGCGKTTLLMCLAGLTKPKRGIVKLNGANLSGAHRNRRAQMRGAHIGIVFQHAELIPELTAQENVMIPALLQGKADFSKGADDLLNGLGVPIETLAQDLSGGEAQRCAIARALINHPALILADEPTGSLDTELRDDIADVLFRLPRERQTALVVVTHDATVAECADQVLELPDLRKAS